MDEAPSAGRLGRMEAAVAGRRLLSLEDRCDDAGLADLPSGLTCPDIHDHSYDNVSKCDFIHCVDSCHNDDGLIDYLTFIYCQMPSKLIPLAMVVLFIWLFFLFLFLGATAEEYFCPALTVMSQVMHLSQNVAGVTLLALGNGAPDIFSAFAAIKQEDDQKASLAVGALFGAGIFVTTIVVGAVTITNPFELTQRPFLRDIIFYMGAVFWTFYLLWTGFVTIVSAVGFVALYVFYVAVVILGRVVYQRWKKRGQRGRATGDIPKPPTQPDGTEMDDSEDPRAPLLVTTPEGMVTDSNGRQQSATPEVNASIQVDDSRPSESHRRLLFRIESTGSLDNYSQSGKVTTGPVIKVTADDGDSSLVSREERLSGASLPGTLRPSKLGLPPDRKQRGSSEAPAAITGYGSISTDGMSPQTHRRHVMRKTVSGALGITEGVGAVVGIPHSPEVWSEIQRPRSHSSRSHSSRSRAHSRSAIIVDPPESSDQQHQPEEEEEEEEYTPLLMGRLRLKKKKVYHPFVKMLLGVWPFGESFRELGLFGKIYEVVKSPASVMLALTVPVVDRNEENSNWNRWLQILQCALAPVFISLITKRGLYLLGGVFPLWTLLLFLSVAVAIVVGFTSQNSKPPIYHCAFAWLGFAVAVVWIYSIANEIVNLLQAFGIVIKLSDGILGLTLLAWGNSIGDAVSNVTMAKQGFPRMAIGACFGGPLLNILLGIGIASVFKTVQRKADGFKFPLYFTQVELLAALFLLTSLCCSLVVISCLKFRLKRLYGGFLIAFYVVFLVMAIIAEAKLFQIRIPGVITA